ncbi:30S ribosomal protein S8 [Candidatus Margulisiibacteriota bacterium]
MAVTDPIADMFTRVRNAFAVQHESVLVPFSKIKQGILQILADEGFIKFSEVIVEENKKYLKVGLKYSSEGKPVLSDIQRISKPGNRVYVPKSKIPKILNGFGMAILSTSKGILSARTARLSNIGGELIGFIY